MSDAKEAYEKIANKYSLPSYDDVNEEFEIHDVEEHFILRNILRKAAEKIEFYVTLLSEVLQPDTGSLSSMHETRFFSDSEKEQMYKLFKKLIKSHRGIIEAVLTSENAQAQFLVSFHSDWKDMKEELLGIVTKMKECWDKEMSMEKDIGYFG